MENKNKEFLTEDYDLDASNISDHYVLTYDYNGILDSEETIYTNVSGEMRDYGDTGEQTVNHKGYVGDFEYDVYVDYDDIDEFLGKNYEDITQDEIDNIDIEKFKDFLHNKYEKQAFEDLENNPENYDKFIDWEYDGYNESLDESLKEISNETIPEFLKDLVTEETIYKFDGKHFESIKDIYDYLADYNCVFTVKAKGDLKYITDEDMTSDNLKELRETATNFGLSFEKVNENTFKVTGNYNNVLEFLYLKEVSSDIETLSDFKFLPM